MTGFFVGDARFEHEPRPWLLWADGGTLVGEDLNPPGFSSSLSAGRPGVGVGGSVASA